MKKKLLPILLILCFVLLSFIVINYYFNRQKIKLEEKTLTVSKLLNFSNTELSIFCNDYNYDCSITYEYSNDVDLNSLISYDIEEFKFIYSKGAYPIYDYSLNFGAAGDLILYSSSKFKVGNTYDYSSIFVDIKDKISSYDIASYTQETLPAGCDSGYPLFCSPYEIVDAGIDVGFDIVATATNHSLDQGAAGLERSVHYYDSKNILSVGTYKQEDVSSLPKILEKNNIKIGILNYTDALNGLTYKPGFEHTVKLYSKELLEKDIAYLKSSNVNFIITYMHWGPEYNTDPSSSQISMAKDLANAGVDVTVGSHTHSINPVDYILSDDGSNNMLVAYSLGNFNAAQHSYIWDTAYGGILEFKLNISVQNNSVIGKSITDVSFFPIFHETYSNGLVIQPLLNSRFSNEFDNICNIVTKLEEIKCYN